MCRLSKCKLGAAGLKRLAVELATAPLLEELECVRLRCAPVHHCWPAITTRSAYALSLRHICRLEDNDLVNNGTDYSGLDALAASLATNGRLRVLGCAAALWGLCLGFSSTLCVPTIHAATLHRHCLLLVLRRRQPFPRLLSVPQLLQGVGEKAGNVTLSETAHCLSLAAWTTTSSAVST